MPTCAHTAGLSDLVGERRCQVSQRKSLSHVGGADFGEEYDADRLFCMLQKKGSLPGTQNFPRNAAICLLSSAIWRSAGPPLPGP